MPEKPKHMRRKAGLHRKKSIQDHDLIEQTTESIKRSQASGLRNQRSNFICNDEEEQTLTGYSCSNMDQLSFISNAELGSRAATDFTNGCGGATDDGLGFDYINEIWGYESQNSTKKYVIAGLWESVLPRRYK